MVRAIQALSLRRRFLLSAFCLGVASAMISAPALARGPDGIADVAEKVIDAVVNVSTTQKVEAKSGEGRRMIPQLPPGSPFEEFFDDFFKNRRGGKSDGLQTHKTNSLGSGFIVDAAGIVVTNNHVIADSDEI
ncbi:MAG TPA: serine protease, partial [Nitrobacter sp.]|nr:serine protease [Nitrobacter sp.]